MGMALLALILVSAFGVLQWALVGSLRQQSQTRAAFLAQQQMEILLNQDEPSSGSGRAADGFNWSSKVAPAGDYWLVEVRVSGPGGASFKLSTERRKDLRRLAYRSNNQLLRTAEDQSEPSLLQPDMQSEYSLSPDGQQLVYVAIHQGRPQLFLNKVSEKGPGELLFVHPEGAREPRFSPDGSRLAFTSRENGFFQVFVWDFKARSWSNWSRNSFHEDSPAWFPDSQRLLVSRGGHAIVEHGVRGNEKIWVPEAQGWNTAPNTDGKTLVFMSSRDGTPDIFGMELATGKLNKLTDGPAYDNFPQIRGTRVLFQSNREGFSRVYSMNLDGSELTPASPEKSSAELPSWAP